MARNHARIWLDINADDDFESLPFDAQALYTRVILTLDDLSYCGVADWRPRRLTTKAPDLTLDRILAAAAHLEAGRYLLFDLDTEEVLARSFIRRDELLRNPKMAGAVVKAYSGIASKKLRAAVVDEIRRVHKENPEYTSWGHPDVGPALKKLMARPGSEEVPYTNQITNGQPVNIGNPEPVPITNTEPVRNGIHHSVSNAEPVGYAETVPIASTSTSTSTPAPIGGLRKSGTSPDEPAPDSDTPPPPNCPKHPGGTDAPCRGCRAARERREAWDQHQLMAAEARRRAFLNELDACTECDEFGWALGDNGEPLEPAIRCGQHDWSPANRGVPEHA